jgi:hypothetical protein
MSWSVAAFASQMFSDQGEYARRDHFRGSIGGNAFDPLRILSLQLGISGLNPGMKLHGFLIKTCFSACLLRLIALQGAFNPDFNRQIQP